jgi:hypothetical protein
MIKNTLTILIVILSTFTYAQNVGINSTGAAPNASAILDIDAAPGNNKGLLVPRMTTAQRNAIVSPVESLLIYNTTTQCYEGYNSTTSAWVAFGCIGCQSPGVFSAFPASSISATSFSANWSTSAGAATYYLDIATDAGFTSFVNGYTNLNVTNVNTYSVIGLSCFTTYFYRIRANNACGTSPNTNTITLTTLGIPTNVTGSATPNPICASATLTLTGSATGATSWSWTGPNSFSSTSQSPVITNITTAGAGTYTLTASNSCGSATAVNTNSVTVGSAPSITSQPSDQSFIAIGANVSFSVTATGIGLSYQWQLSTDGGSTWNNQANGGVYSNMTTATMNITSAPLAIDSSKYRCVVSGTCLPNVTSNAAILTISKQVAYTTSGTYTWTCPVGVTSVSVVCVGAGGGGWNSLNNNSRGGGGGGLGYKNNISVVPGNNYTVVVGAGAGSGGIGGDSYFISSIIVAGIGGQGDDISNPFPTAGGGHVGDGGGNGGNGGQSTSYGGGGGAGGYSGNGGNGGGTSGAGGGGGGATDAAANPVVGYGGGVGILGQGGNGTTGPQGGGGSGGQGGFQGGGNYGGGSYGGSGAGGGGAVRIIWPGNLRVFPSTRAADE